MGLGGVIVLQLELKAVHAVAASRLLLEQIMYTMLTHGATCCRDFVAIFGRMLRKHLAASVSRV